MRIKILVDAHVFDHSCQGTTTYIKGIYNALVQYDEFDITLCANDIDTLKRDFQNPKFKFIKLKSISRIKRLLFEIPNIIRDNQFDYAHFQYIVSPFKNCKYINTIHDLLFLQYKEYFPLHYRVVNKILFKFSAKRSNIVLTVSSFSKEMIMNEFGLDSGLIKVIPNAVSPCDPVNINIKEEFHIKRDFIHFVSRFEPRKNQLGLLKAYIELKLFNKYDLVFIGRKKDRIEREYFKKVEDVIPVDIRQYIHFFDSLSTEKLNAFYQQSSCFIYPSFAEGFGIPPLEAGINNCKVLCSNQTAMSDFAFFEYTFDPNLFDDFKLKLSNILIDSSYPFEVIKNKILSKYNWNNIGSDLRQIILNDYKMTK